MKKHVTWAAVLLTVAAQAQTPRGIDKADTVWVLVSSVLVLLMTPALALFYGGMVRRKNILNTMLHSVMLMGVVTVVWVVAGYSLAFGHSNGFIGNLQYLFGNGISNTAPYGTQTVPASVFMLFQMMFAIITPALISGAIAERMKFSGYLLFTLCWALLIYAPVACWVWNPEGWLNKMGALDFAGGTVVHLASGAAALACCIALGRRSRPQGEPNNIPLVLLGGGMLWVGWIGFNAGSALAANDTAAVAFVATQVAAASGLIGWTLAEKLRTGKVTAMGAASGLVAGLVGVTPAAGFVAPGGAMAIGLVAGVACYFATNLKSILGFDDALDVVAVHGLGGLVGAVLTGIFASAAVNPAVKDSLVSGRMHLILVQLLAVGAVLAFSFLGSLGLMKLVQVITGVRVSESQEEAGLDISLHGEHAYGVEHADTPELTPVHGVMLEEAFVTG